MAIAIEFVSLAAITQDLLYIIRGSQVTQSESISWRQIENWIHQYRALMIKRDLDKNKSPNPDYIQEIPSIKLIKVDKIGRYSTITTGEYSYRTEMELPKTIDLNFKSGIIFICTLDGQEIQLIPQSRAEWRRHRKYSNREPYAYLRNGFLYVEGPNAVSHIFIRGIFEVPTEVDNLLIDLSTYTWVNYSLETPKEVNLGGSNAPRTSASDAAVDLLISKGVTVTTN